ncbi:MAG: hypothetical protein JWN25_2665 [Verrucomicrobiales bacterium]|nr:hypothetical protein [Verrucomicrobiales bacterium]
MDLTEHLKIAGLLQIALGVAHFWLPDKLGWESDCAKMTLFTRQVFFVHCFFIVLVLFLFGSLSFGCADLLVRRDPLAKWLLMGIASFWLIRLFCQFFVYDSRIWRGNRTHTVIHAMTSLMWGYYGAVYGIAWWRQL